MNPTAFLAESTPRYSGLRISDDKHYLRIELNQQGNTIYFYLYYKDGRKHEEYKEKMEFPKFVEEHIKKGRVKK